MYKVIEGPGKNPGLSYFNERLPTTEDNIEVFGLPVLVSKQIS